MKILFISAANSIHTVRWVNGLAERGHEIVLVSLKNHMNETDKISTGVRKIYLPVKGKKGYYLNALFLRRLFIAGHFDTVNVHYASGYGTLARIAGLPNIFLSVWGSDVYDFPYEGRIKKHILIKNLKYAAMIGSTSHIMAEQVKTLLTHKKAIEVIPFGVNLDDFSPKTDSRKNETIFGIVKTLSPKYGVEDVLKSFVIFYSRLPKEEKKKVQLKIYGKGELSGDLKTQAEKWNVADKVTFEGYIPHREIPKILKEIDIFLLGSKKESFGVSAVEAMACGLPIIATDADGFREVIEDGVTGCLIPVGDVNAMADRMMELYCDSRLRGLMGKRGRQRAEQLYDWEQCMDNMIMAYEKLAIKKSCNGKERTWKDIQKKKRCIMHIPAYIDLNRPSASQIRPVKMKEAFEGIGYTVDMVHGYGKSRKRQIAQIKKNIRQGLVYEFLYAESSTMPSLLTEKHHLPVYPFLDFGFFKFMKKRGIKAGLFYRDIYWKFPEYEINVKGFLSDIAILLYQYDLRQYRKLLDKVYLPSARMYTYLKKDIPANMIGTLPPGCDNIQICNRHTKKEKLTLLYIGGIGAHYRMHKVLQAAYSMPQIDIILCCRKEEWEREYPYYEEYIRDNIHIFHEKNDGLEKLYQKADLGLAFFENSAYRDMSMPYKVFEYLGHGLPVIASKGTAAGDFVTKENAGWAIEYNTDSLIQLLMGLLKNQNDMFIKKEAARSTGRRHTWVQRAKKVERDLR